MEEYFKEIEVTLIRAQVIVSQEVTMTRFLHGLNRDIQDFVELHEYTSLSTLYTNLKSIEKELTLPQALIGRVMKREKINS
ncbi:hypothetical protein CR513_07216, partial [Mucuna pruriens]